MGEVGTPRAGRKVLRLSRTTQKDDVKGDGGAGVGRGAWPSAHAKPRADLSAEEAATSVLAAVNSAAQSLGQTPVSGQLSAAQVLSDPPSRQAAARWRSGDTARRVTAALAKVSQLLQEWVVPHSPPTGAPAVAQPRPVRPANHRDTARADNVAGAAVRWLPSLPRLRVDWRLLLLLTVVLLFPRVVALSVALVVRLVLRAVGNLFASLVKELYTQALLTSAELESQLVDWLQEQMGMAPPAVPAQLPPPGGAPTAAAPPPSSLPTRPAEWATIVLLNLFNLRQRALGGGGGEGPQRLP